MGGWQGNNRRRRGERQFTNMVDSSYVGLFLYQNIFKGLKKKKNKEKTDLDREIKDDFQKSGVTWRWGMFSVSVNARVGVVHAV